MTKNRLLIGVGCLLVLTLAACLPAPAGAPASSTPPTPAASPAATAAPLDSPTAAAPAPGASARASAQPPAQVDFSQEQVPYRDRSAWQALLGWPGECDEAFQNAAPHAQDWGGITFYEVANGQYLVFVTCTLGPYWVEEAIYLLDNRASPPAAKPLALPQLVREDGQGWVQHDVYLVHGSYPTYQPDTQTLTNLEAFRGFKDCGFFYAYHFEQERFVLDEVRYQEECNDSTFIPSNEWPIIYQRVPATPPAALATSGPYLVYKKSADEQDVLVVVDAGGQGRATWPLPAGASLASLEQAVSPDGAWLAFYSGSAGEPGGDQAGHPDLALNLMDLTDGHTQPLAALLSADYPDTFRQAADALAQQGSLPLEGLGPVELSAFLHEAFLSGIHSLAWSPDGRYLAFAGQMDGLSSDLYVYDRQSQAITRLSDGPEQIQSITWSPDGKWILHGSAHTRGEGAPIQYYAAAPDGSAVKTLSSSILGPQGWAGPSTYLQSQASNGPAGTFDLQRVEIETGRVESIWGGTFVSFALDPRQGVLAISGFESVGQAGAPGLFLVDLADGAQRKIGERVSKVEFLGLGDKRFIFRASEGETLATWFVLADGSKVKAGYAAGQAAAAPDGTLVLVAGQDLQVYTANDTLVRTIELPRPASVERVMWRPDASGFFFTLDAELYGVELLGGETYRVDEGVPAGASFDYVWVTGR